MRAEYGVLCKLRTAPIYEGSLLSSAKSTINKLDLRRRHFEGNDNRSVVFETIMEILEPIKNHD